MLRSWRDAALHLVPTPAGMQGFCSPPHPSSRMSESIVSLMIQSGICTFCLFASCSNDNHKSNAPFPPSWFPTSGLLDLRVPLLKVEPALKNHRPPPVGSSSLGICIPQVETLEDFQEAIGSLCLFFFLPLRDGLAIYPWLSW